MNWMLLTALGVVVYFVGFVVTGAIEERTCDRRERNHVSAWDGKCNHPWATPLPLLWPVGLVIAAFVLPFWLTFGGAAKLSHKLATVPTATERRERREKIARENQKQLKQRVWKLEDELGYERSEL